MNENKEQDTQDKSEDWWFQYLSEEEKKEQQSTADGQLEQAELETPQSVWKPMFIRVKKYLPKVALVAGVVLAISHWVSTSSNLSELELEHQETLDRLAQSNAQLSVERAKIISQNAALVKERENFAQLEGQRANASGEVAHLKESLRKVVQLSQEIYALKTEASHGVLLELKDEAQREEKIRELWAELSESLKADEAFVREQSLIQLRVVQSRALSGTFERKELDAIDWETPEMGEEKPWFLIRTYYKQARALLMDGKHSEAKVLIEDCIELLEGMDQSGAEFSYIRAKVYESHGDLHLNDEPRVALKSYLKAIGDLGVVVNTLPDKRNIRLMLAQLCESVSQLPSVDGKSEWSDGLKRVAREQAAWLVKVDPENEKAHLIMAQLDVNSAEESLRNRDLNEVVDLLDRANKSLKSGGGDVLLLSSIEGVRAFMAWDRGSQTSAIKLMNEQVNELTELIVNEPENTVARRRCAAMLWGRSMMQTSTSRARADGKMALDHLDSLLEASTCLNSVFAQRMSARILCDLAELEMHVGSKSQAKNYLVRSEKLWAEVRHKWGLSAEDREMEHWCVYQLALF